MFLKPEVSKECADRLAFNLNYTPTLNWLTYQKLLEMSKLLMEHLRPLGAREMIDVQSFMWVIGQGKLTALARPRKADERIKER